MYSTGPLFLSVIWKEYIRWGTTEEGRVRILMPDEYVLPTISLYAFANNSDRYIKKPWSFFTYHKGSSWHDEDAQAIFWVRDLTLTP